MSKLSFGFSTLAASKKHAAPKLLNTQFVDKSNNVERDVEVIVNLNQLDKSLIEARREARENLIIPMPVAVADATEASNATVGIQQLEQPVDGSLAVKPAFHGGKSAYGLQRLSDAAKKKKADDEAGSERAPHLRSREPPFDNSIVGGVAPEEHDYERIPIDKFGVAMLRGMGWQPDKGIGNTNVVRFGPVEVERRPKGLGLGATPPARPLPTRNSASNHAAGADGAIAQQSSDDAVRKAVSNYVTILDGKWKGYTGKIVSVDGDTDRYEVELHDGVSNRYRVVTVLGYAIGTAAAESTDSQTNGHAKATKPALSSHHDNDGKRTAERRSTTHIDGSSRHHPHSSSNGHHHHHRSHAIEGERHREHSDRRRSPSSRDGRSREKRR